MANFEEYLVDVHVVAEGPQEYLDELYTIMTEMEAEGIPSDVISNIGGSTYANRLIKKIGGTFEDCRAYFYNTRREGDLLYWDEVSRCAFPGSLYWAIELFYPGTRVYFFAENPRQDYYITNVAGGYRWVFSLNDEWEYFFSDDELFKRTSEIAGTEIKDLPHLRRNIVRNPNLKGAYFHRVQNIVTDKLF